MGFLNPPFTHSNAIPLTGHHRLSNMHKYTVDNNSIVLTLHIMSNSYIFNNTFYRTEQNTVQITLKKTLKTLTSYN